MTFDPKSKSWDDTKKEKKQHNLYVKQRSYYIVSGNS